MVMMEYRKENRSSQSLLRPAILSHHILLVKVSYRDISDSEVEKWNPPPDERSGKVSLQKECRMGKTVASIFGYSLP